MIIFRNVKWKNLLSTGNYFTEIKLDSTPNTLVVGENGSGKSTMLDALCFALFGKPFRSINKPQLVNSINGKDCVVEVSLDTNNKNYRIVRGIKPNVFEIYCNGELINQEAASRDYQELLEKYILKLNYKSFTQIVILGSASFTPFMQLSASDRRSIIEELFRSCYILQRRYCFFSFQRQRSVRKMFLPNQCRQDFITISPSHTRIC